MTGKPKIVVSVTNDLNTDQRVHRTCMALSAQGFQVLLVGRELPKSEKLPEREYAMKRFRLWIHKGPLFYALYNIRLFFFLLFSDSKALFANDLDTLPANFLVSKLKDLYLVYDSHEYYTGVPELENRPLVKSIWRWIEKSIFPNLKCIITVNDSIATLYEKEYGKKLIVIRNIPNNSEIGMGFMDKNLLRDKLNLPKNKKIVILQGAGINIERGAEEAVQAMQYIDDTILIILGGGDVLEVLKKIVVQNRLENKVLFLPRMPYLNMIEYTRASDAGLTFDKDTNLNYRFSLPNKVFDYIHAGIPVLASRLPEIEKIIVKYEIGSFIETHDPKHIAKQIQFMVSDEGRIVHWQKNLQIASRELNWAQEVKKFPSIINELH